MSFYKIRTYIRQNSKRLLLIAFGAAIFFVVLQLMNQFAIVNRNIKNKQSAKELEVSKQKQQELHENPSMQTIISGENVDKEKNDINVNLINNFNDACNNGKIEEAYNMLSSECKEVLFPSLDDFKNNYYSLVFTEKRSCKIQSWIQSSGVNTYKITIHGDLLSTGGKSDSETIDYYTIVKENEEEKLNINSYIKRQNLNGNATCGNLEIEVNYKDIYMDYEIYNFTIKNNDSSTVILDTQKSTTATYLKDQNQINYLAYIHELSNEELKINSKTTDKLEIKFNKVYNTSRKIENIVFSDVLIEANDESRNEKIEIPITIE